MMPIATVVFCFLAAVLILDFFLRGRKIQTRITIVLIVHAVAAVLTAAVAYRAYDFTPIAVLTFWLGAFLTWFGVRSHIESSILLRMLYMIGNGQMKRQALLQQYRKYYGTDLRLRELQLAGLLRKTAEGRLQPTTKGRSILRIANWLGAKPVASV